MNHKFRLAFGLVVVLFVFLSGLACSVGDFIPSFGVQPTVAAVLPPVETQLAQIGKTPLPALPTLVATLSTLPTLEITLPTLPSATQTSIITNVQSGLEKVDSYRMTFVMKVVGKDRDGKDANQEMKLLQEVIKSKESVHTLMNSSGVSATDSPGYIEIYQISKIGYMLVTDPSTKKFTCLSYSSDKPIYDQNALMTPDEMLGGIQKDVLIGRGETVNGVKTDHYKLAQANVGSGLIRKGAGEVWIAQDGGYVVRLVSQSDGEFTLSSKTVTGTTTVTYDLTDVNKIAQITVPAECTAASEGMKDLPIPANATDKSSIGDIQTFSSPDAPKAVADYFRKELPAQGWKITKDSSFDTVVMLSAEKDSRKFSIMITPGKDNKGSSVIITKEQ